MRRRRNTKPREDLMDQISAAAAAGDDAAIARLTDQARLEDLDRRRGAAALPIGLDLAADEIIANLRREVDRARAYRDPQGERDALERLASFEQRAGRA
jgi:hypothetical protein